MGEVDADGWESGGPLSQSKKAARACGSRHACDAKGELRCVVKEVERRRGVSCSSSIPGQQMSGPVEGEEG